MSGAASRTGFEIAIVGMACRLPGANDLDAYWRNLSGGVWSVTRFSDADLLAAGVARRDFEDARYVRANAVVDDADAFDAGYFDFSPREAEMLDPQHRVFLECCADALAAAGYDSARQPFLTGVYAGANANTYFLGLQSGLGMTESTTNLQPLLGNDKDYLATRVSYKLNLRGPSVTVQTACSTSLVAVHLACRALLGGECDMALAGGVSIRVPQKAGYLYADGGIHSPDGYCRAFDARAQGTTFGSGAGVVVLKRLDQAIADRDHIHAVILGSAVNNDGAAKVGYTAPSLAGQVEVIRAAHQIASIDPRTISYVEAHATGTPLGDPIEVQALTESFRAHTADTQFCALGAVKTNFGHLVTAAGIAGLIKTVLSLTHRQIPPTLHFEQPNPHLDLERSPFFVNTTLREWPNGAGPRRAAVSSFGVGGTNAHLVLEEAPRPAAPPPAVRPYQVLPLSAGSDRALDALTHRVAAALDLQPDAALPDVAYTLQVGRRPLASRRVAIAKSMDDARAALRAGDRTATVDGTHDGTTRPVMFLFPGQGLQHVGMAKDVWRAEPVFRSHLDTCCDLLRAPLGLDLRSILYPAAADEARAAERLNQTAIAQPALFVVEYALAQQLIAWGVTPHGMIGHSVGEYVAAAIAGVFDLKDALAIVAERGRLMQHLPPGAMVAVPLSASAVEPFLGDGLALACVNGPEACVVSGAPATVDALERRLADNGLSARRLRTSHAFHSAMLDPMLTPFLDRLRRVTLRPPQIPFVSNVTGQWIAGDEAIDPAYWVRHARQTVQFADGVGTLLREPHAILLEAGPGQALTAMVMSHAARRDTHTLVDTLAGASDRRSDELLLLRGLSRLWTAGVPVDWDAFAAVEQRQRVPLPPYPFERQRYWFSAPAPVATTSGPVDEERRPDAGVLLSKPAWRQAALATPAEAAASTWLLFVDRSPLGDALASRLGEKGHRVVRVASADGDAATAAGDETIDPKDANAYAEVIRRARQSGEPLTHVVHAWTASTGDGGSHQPGDACIDRGFHSLLYLAQALGREAADDPLTLTVVTSHVHDIAGETRPCPEHATIAGACQVIPLEYPDVRCRLVDVAIDGPGAAIASRVADQVIAECEADAADTVIAYRRHDRWVRTWAALDGHARPVSRLRDGGVYLVTGAFGGIGLQIADRLATLVPGAKLVLVGRTAPPEPESWAQWIAAHDETDARTRIVRRLEAIQARGAAVLPIAADVTDPGAMRAAVRRAVDRFGAIHGVVHAAGTVATDLIQSKTAASAAGVLAPKVRGTRVLEQLFADAPLDFFVLFSSTIAITGAVGQADYCAANAFLDAFAHRAAATGSTGTLSIDWDGWRGVGLNSGRGDSAEMDQPIDHPILRRRVWSADHFATFAGDVDASRDWVVAEHVVGGEPTMPGTAFLEIARAAFAAATGRDAVSLEHVFFTAPLAVPAGTVRGIRVVLDQDGDGFQFRIASAEEPDPAGETEYARGRLIDAGAPATTPALADVLARCPRQMAPGDVPRGAGGQLVRWGPRWNNVRAVHAGDGELVVVHELPDQFAADLDVMPLHPAIVDVATATLAVTSGLDDFIPISYGRVSVHGRLTPTVYSHVRRQGSSHSKHTAAFAVTLYDADRRPVVHVDDFVMMHESRLQAVASPGTSAADDRASARPKAATARDDIAPNDALEIFARLLSTSTPPQVVVSAEDLNARLARMRAATLEPGPTRRDGRPAKTGGLYPRPALATEYVAPSGETEPRVAEIWQEALGIERVGVHDNFFELGGHSLLAAQIIDRLRRVFGIEISLSTVLEEPTVARTAVFVDQARRAREDALQRALLERLASLSEDDAAAELRRYSA